MDTVKNNKTLVIIITLIIVFVFLGFVETLINASGKENKLVSITPTKTIGVGPTTQINNTLKPTVTPKYEIIYQIDNIRYDGGVEFYVLIDKVNLTNDSFKNDIKSYVKEIVALKGGKISINFLDDKQSLDIFYTSHYGNNSLGRILNKTERDLLAIHNVASFDGELQTGLYLNALYFFPSTFSDEKQVGKYVGSIEFNP